MGNSIRGVVRAAAQSDASPEACDQSRSVDKPANGKGNGKIVLPALIGVMLFGAAIDALKSGSGSARPAPVQPATPLQPSALPTPPDVQSSTDPSPAITADAPPSDGMVGPPHLRHPDTSGDAPPTGDIALAQREVLIILNRVEQPCAKITWVQPDPNIENTYDVACRTKRGSTKEVAYIVEPITGVVGHL